MNFCKRYQNYRNWSKESYVSMNSSVKDSDSDVCEELFQSSVDAQVDLWTYYYIRNGLGLDCWPLNANRFHYLCNEIPFYWKAVRIYKKSGSD